MKPIDLHLGIARPIGKAKSLSNTKNPKIENDLKQKIIQRDDFTCQCCSFRSEKYQDVHTLNNNPLDHSEKNLATVCIFCHQCFNLEKVNDMRSGVLVWLPEIEQATLHHIARAIYVARISQGPVADAARKSLDILMARKDEAQRRLGSDRPEILAAVLKDYLGEKHYYNRKDKLNGLRLLPLDRRIIKEADLEFNQFPQILAFWRSRNGPFGGKTPPQWLGIYKSLMEKTL